MSHLAVRGFIVLAGFFLWTLVAVSAAEDRRERVLKDRAEVQTRGDWVYNDLATGLQEAKQTGKPLLVVFRCIP